MNIKETLKFYRKQYKLTQTELGEKLGVSQDAISQWEKGKAQPNYEILRKLCILFDISGDEVLDIETESQRNQVNVNRSFNSYNVSGNNNKITF